VGDEVFDGRIADHHAPLRPLQCLQVVDIRKSTVRENEEMLVAVFAGELKAVFLHESDDAARPCHERTAISLPLRIAERTTPRVANPLPTTGTCRYRAVGKFPAEYSARERIIAAMVMTGAATVESEVTNATMAIRILPGLP
jgi:hypothetical protein